MAYAPRRSNKRLICFTFAKPFDDIFLFVKLCIGQRKYKQKFRKDRQTDRPTDQASEFTLAHLTPILHFCKIVVKMIKLALPIHIQEKRRSHECRKSEIFATSHGQIFPVFCFFPIFESRGNPRLLLGFA